MEDMIVHVWRNGQCGQPGLQVVPCVSDHAIDESRSDDLV